MPISKVFPRLETIAPADAGPPGDERVSTGVPGLDKMMAGGLPGADATAVLGPSGSGKTVLALRFIAKGLEEGERCLYGLVPGDERPARSQGGLLRLGSRFPQESGQLRIHHVPQGDLNLDAVGAVVRAELAKGGVRRVVLDSLAELVFAAREAERFPAYARTLLQTPKHDIFVIS